MLSLPAFSARWSPPRSTSAPLRPGNGPMRRKRSPPGGSTLMTRAPRSARSREAKAPPTPSEASITTTSASGGAVVPRLVGAGEIRVK